MTFRPWSALSRNQQIAAVVLIAIAAGALTAPQVYAYTDSSEGSVAVIEVSGLIDSNNAAEIEAELREARENDSVEAVVLDVDSGGGQPASSERIYTAVERTAAEMPVTAAVDQLGASGAYYAMLPTDEIYVSASSGVGSVGVMGPAPTPSAPSEGTSGPDKGTSHPDDERTDTELIKQTFLESVFEQRGDDLELTREEVAHARTYLGTEAVDNGIADDIGTVDDAIHAAASDAGMSSYEIDFRESTAPTAGTPLGIDDAAEQSDADAQHAETQVSPHQPLLVTPEVWYELPETDGSEQDAAPQTTPATTGGDDQ